MGDGNDKKADDDNKLKFGEGNAGICMRLLFFCIAVSAFSCSMAALGKCDLFIYEPRTPPDGVEDTRPEILLDVTIATVGLFKYDANYEGCRDISDNFDQLSGWFTAAQVGISLAVLLGATAIALLLVDLICCRFPCGRFLISILFLIAFICQALVFLVYAAPICDPNYVNGPFPCSPDTATWLCVAACVLFLISGLLACCVPKPLPVVVRVKRNLQNDETDGCCAIFAKKPKEEENEGADEEQAPAVVAGGGAVVQPGEEEPKEPTAEELQADQTQAAVAADLAAVRRAKQDEIEKQLELLTKYKDHLSEEEYDEKVTKLIHALPDPDTYDAFTKTDAILPVEEEEADVEEGGEDEEGEGEEEGEEKKSLGKKITTSVGTVGSAMGSAMKGVKNTVTGGGSSKTPKEDAGDASALAPEGTV